MKSIIVRSGNYSQDLKGYLVSNLYNNVCININIK